MQVLDFRLSGAIVRVTPGSPASVAVHRIARTRSTDGSPATTELSDASFAPSLTPPGSVLPGRIDFGANLPSVRVTPSTLPAAQALMELLESGPDIEGAAAPPASGFGATVPGATVPGPGDSEAVDSGAADSEEADSAPRTKLGGDIPDPDFFAFDVETANADEGSVIQFGIAAVRDGKVTETHSWPCRPPAGLEQFDEGNIAIHGITPSDVVDAPTFAERAAEFGRLVDGTPVIAHNAKFDFTALKRGCAAAGIDVPDVAYACTYEWARRVGLQVENYRLPTLAREAASSDFSHHDAADDAAACAEVALWLMREHPGAEPTLNPVQYTANLGMDMGMLFGTRLVPMQTTGQSQVGSGGGGRRQAGSRGRSGGGQQDRRAKWDAVKAPEVIPDRNDDADPDGLLYGQRVTLTGDFAPYDKGRLWELIAHAGADINKGVTKKTTILVAGPWDSMTSKEKKAREYKEKGQEIEIWDEKQLFTVLGLEEEPPF
ncbi:exonuclease domain-containing protein [Corynebacterium sp. NPDC060344]|uniref:exonuclease domain-containing protein n=1 Tax=Corynebacterium sp. NPDC060344 TaxID=3347101 RepID=UPI00366A18D7